VKLPLSERIGIKFEIFTRQLTVPIRILPSFIIFGVPRCGTTSLYNYLVQHPSIIPALTKEINFFALNFLKGVSWYKMHFPIILEKYKIRKDFRDYFMTGEGSATSIYHPHASSRIKKTIPNVKLIVMLRNPVDRALSQYFKIVKIGREKLSFEEAIKAEEGRIRDERKKMLQEENYYSLKIHRFSYLSGGKYIEYLKPWFDLFSKEQILVLKSEDLYEEPAKIYKKTLKFLNLPEWELPQYKKYNYLDDKPKMNPIIRKNLVDYFRPYNEKLYKYLGKNFRWEK